MSDIIARLLAGVILSEAVGEVDSKEISIKLVGRKDSSPAYFVFCWANKSYTACDCFYFSFFAHRYFNKLVKKYNLKKVTQ